MTKPAVSLPMAYMGALSEPGKCDASGPILPIVTWMEAARCAPLFLPALYGSLVNRIRGSYSMYRRRLDGTQAEKAEHKRDDFNCAVRGRNTNPVLLSHHKKGAENSNLSNDNPFSTKQCSIRPT